MLFLVATNVVASRPPERRLTGTLHACAKSFVFYRVVSKKFPNKFRFLPVPIAVITTLRKKDTKGLFSSDLTQVPPYSDDLYSF